MARLCIICGNELPKGSQGRFCTLCTEEGKKLLLERKTKKCARPECNIIFTPTNNKQKYHNDECREKAKWQKRKALMHLEREVEKEEFLPEATEFNVADVFGELKRDTTNFSKNFTFDTKERR